MPLLSGAMGGRRYKVLGEFRADSLDAYIDRLREHGFNERFTSMDIDRREHHGWVTLANLADIDFSTQNTVFSNYLAFSLRMDSKTLPGKLVKAMLDLRVRQWLADTGRDRIPANIKREMSEQLQTELWPRQLPSVAAHDVCWNLDTQIVWFLSNSNKANEAFQGHFARTFSLDTRPMGALHLIADHPRASEWVPQLDVIGHEDYRPQPGFNRRGGPEA